MSDKQQEKRERRIEKMQKNDQEKGKEQKALMKKGFIIVAILLTIPAFALLGRLLSKPTEGLDGANSVEIVENDHIKGVNEAKVTIVEYSDFQCPACGAYYPIIKRLEEEYPNDVRFVYRHLPLKQIHKNAERAAQASEAAEKQGKFFEMHDNLFENQDEWSESDDEDGFFLKYAEGIGLDVEQFATDIDSSEVSDRVNNDIKASYTLNLSSTPSFFMNGSKIDNPNGYENFKKLIDGQINQ